MVVDEVAVAVEESGVVSVGRIVDGMKGVVVVVVEGAVVVVRVVAG